MDDGAKSFWEWWKEKTSSSVYFTYFVAFLSWNWKAIYILFLTDDSINFARKLHYVANNQYFGDDSCLNWVFNHAWAIIPPAGFTYFAVKYFSHISKWAHGIETEAYFDRLRTYETKNLSFIIWKNSLLAKEVSEIEKEKVLSEKRSIIKKEIASREDAEWGSDFEKLNSSQLRADLGKLRYIIHDHAGRLQRSPTGQLYGNDAEAISFGDLNDLINIDQKNGVINFTPKGKYFAKRASEFQEK